MIDLTDDGPTSDDDDRARRLREIEKEISRVEEEIWSLHEKRDRLEEERELLTNFIPAKERRLETVDWRKDFDWSPEVSALMHNTFNLAEFRPHQAEVINATLYGRDVFLIMRSGGGKSLCYQLPAVLQGGLTVVVSPLISLIHDQVTGMNSILPNTAAMLSSDTSREHSRQIYVMMQEEASPLRLIYVTPEKILKSKQLMSALEKVYRAGRLRRHVIDEAHCCSQWGHDFRSDYARLGILRKDFPDTPILAVTATSRPGVVEDVKKILQIRECEYFRSSFNRPNLTYEVRKKPRQNDKAVADIIEMISQRHAGESGIIYCLTRAEAEQVCGSLQQHSMSAAFYHAYLDPGQKMRIHNGWLQGKIQIVVATIAFGLGINKPSVRFVIHFTLSKSLEGYYQESGRAGRDGEPATCLLLYRPGDFTRVACMTHTEVGGSVMLHRMISYCEERNRCRRKVMAEYFGEDFDDKECNATCDNCAGRSMNETHDLSGLVVVTVNLLRRAEDMEKRMTLNQLVDKVYPACKNSAGTSGFSALHGLSKDDVEGALTRMVLEGILRETFSYTAYRTNCYIVEGMKARPVVEGKLAFTCQFSKENDADTDRRGKRKRTRRQ